MSTNLTWIWPRWRFWRRIILVRFFVIVTLVLHAYGCIFLQARLKRIIDRRWADLVSLVTWLFSQFTLSPEDRRVDWLSPIWPWWSELSLLFSQFILLHIRISVPTTLSWTSLLITWMSKLLRRSEQLWTCSRCDIGLLSHNNAFSFCADRKCLGRSCTCISRRAADRNGMQGTMGGQGQNGFQLGRRSWGVQEAGKILKLNYIRTVD